MKKLPKEFKEKWIAALRSGEYKQAQGTLIEKYGGKTKYCCLGVAGKVCGFSDRRMNGIDAYGILHNIHKSKRAVKDGYPELLLSDGMGASVSYRLASMNDSGKSFEEIANWIEENL